MSIGLEVAAPDWAALTRLAERVERDLGERVRPAERRSGGERLRDAVLGLARALPEGTLDHEARRLLEFTLALEEAIGADPDGQDGRGLVDLAAIRLRDVTGRIRRRVLRAELDDPTAAAAFALSTLQGVPAGETGRLLGVSAKTVGAWRAGAPVAPGRLRVVVIAQVLAELRGFLTPRGMMMWFDSPRDQLGLRTPRELLDAGVAGAAEALVGLARGGRAQLAG